MKHTEHSLVAVLHNVRSTHNVGSALRTSDAAGVDHLYLSGYTPLPVDRFGRPVPEIKKTALGAEYVVPWSKATSFAALCRRLSQEGYTIIALENGVPATDYRKMVYPHRVALVVGNEVDGLRPAQLNRTDAVIEIPMHGQKESLNVSVALGIALFRVREALGN